MLLLSGVAAAAPLFLSVGAETVPDPDHSGNWPRAFATDEGWLFFYASAGDYSYMSLDDSLVPVSSARRLTGRTDLLDHAIARCPDGSWLHAASYTTTTDDDSMVAYLYDADLNLVEEQLITEGAGAITRDMPAVCGDTFKGVGLFGEVEGVFRPAVHFVSVSSGMEPAWHLLDSAPQAEGSGWIEGPEGLWAVGGIGTSLHIRGFNTSYARTTMLEAPVVAEPLWAYWPQQVIDVGDYRVTAFVAADPAAGWQGQDGDIYLAAFDADWNVVETIAVTAGVPPVGNMQPGVALKEDRLLVTYVRDLTNYAVYVPIDAAFAGLDVDYGWPDTGEPVDTGGPTETGEPAETGGGETAEPVDSAVPGETAEDTGGGDAPTPRAEDECGCGGGSAAGLVPLVFVWRRRRRGAAG